MNDHLPVKNFRIYDILQADLDMASAREDHNALFLLLSSASFRCLRKLPVLLQRAKKHGFKFLLRKGLYQIVKSPHIKGPEHIVLHRRHKNKDHSFMSFPEHPCSFHPVRPRHLDVQKHNIRRLFRQKQFFSRCITQDLRLRTKPFYFFRQHFPYLLLIVTNRYPHFSFHLHPAFILP